MGQVAKEVRGPLTPITADIVPVSTRCALHTRGCVAMSRTLTGLWLRGDQRIIGGVDDPVRVRPHWPR